jgi:hypothetical protein
MSTTISNISEYLNCIKGRQISKGKVQFTQSNVYYRGEADTEWKLQPAVFRESENKEHYDEYRLIKMATAQSWSLIHSSDSFLERLIMFQHYGLKTRLYDVTSNPLVALFFAVSGQFDKSGRVIYGHCNNNYNNDIAEIVARIISTTDKKWMGGPCYYIGQWFEWAKQSRVLDKEDFENLLCKPLYVYPPLNSPRISAQNGAFLMPPLLERQKAGLKYRKDFEFTQGKDDSFFETEEIIIESKNKPVILDELKSIGIDENSMFPEMEHIMRSINSNCIIS